MLIKIQNLKYPAVGPNQYPNNNLPEIVLK